MVKNIVFLLVCVLLVVLAWMLFSVLGQYAFVIMLVITMAVLVVNVGKRRGEHRNSQE